MNNALAFMSGLANGYVRGKQLRGDLDEREEERALRRERNDRERTEAARAEKLRTDLGAAAAPREVASGEVFQPAVDDDGNQMPANPTAGSYMAGGQRYADRGAADAAAQAANAPQAQTQRMAGVYMANGMPAQAQQLTTGQRQAEVADLQLDSAKEQAESSKTLREIGSLLAKGGWSAVPTLHERYKDGLTSKVAEDGKGGAAVTLFDKDGKQVGAPQVYTDLPEFFARSAAQFDPKLWVADAKERRKDAREDAKDKVDADYKMGSLRVAEKNAATNESYRQDLADNGRIAAEASATRAETRAGSAVDRMPEHEKLAFQAGNKRLEDIDKRLMELQSDPMADQSDPGTIAALGNLKKMRAATALQVRQIYERNAGSAPTADPAGLRAPAPGAAPAQMAGATRVAPQEQAARDKDRAAILQQEFAAAQQRAGAARDPQEQARAQADLAALTRELQRAGLAPPAQMAPAAAAPAAPAAPAAAPAPAAMAPSPAPAKAAKAKPAATGDQVLNQITEKNEKAKADRVAIYSIEVQKAEEELRSAAQQQNPNAIRQAAAKVMQARQALELVQKA